MVTRFGNVQQSGFVELHSSGVLSADVVQQAEDAVHDARRLVQRTKDRLANDATSSEVTKYGNRYFRTNSYYMEPEAVRIILANFILIDNGLNVTEHLKIFNSGDTLRGLENGANGWIASYDRLAAIPKNYHNILGDKRIGATHILQDRLAQGRLGVKTVIHEWSHKYAGTVDAKPTGGYINDEGTGFRLEPLTKDKLLNNADSYAWFALKVGRSKDGFRNNMYA
jgi:hypothetical protein